jgi:RNA polymerase sigma-70 factor (ECF subfamily)
MPGTTERLRNRLGEDLEPLVHACLAGDESAWRVLLEAVRQMAFDLGRRTYHLPLDDAEDLAQVVQIRVSERLGQLREAAAFPLWVRRLAHHAMVDLLRQRRSYLSLDSLPEPDVETMALPRFDDTYDRVLLRTDLDRALTRLPARYREPIRLHLLRGIPQDEVGRRLGRPRSTVATQIERGLTRLRRSLSTMAV